MKIKKHLSFQKKGFTLVELILSLAVASIITFLTFQSMNKDFEHKQATAAGEQIKNIGMAVNNYIVNHYDSISKLQNSVGSTLDIGPRTCDISKQICEITTQTLVKEGMLPPAYINKNVYNSGYKIILSRKGSSPYWHVSALIATDTPLVRNGNIRYDLLGKAMQFAGVDSGMTRNVATTMNGFKGTWSVTQADYTNINNLGLLGYIAGYGSNSYSAFLRRDGTLPMTGDLNMGTKNIYDVNNITASATISGGALKSNDSLNVGGVSTLTGDVSANNKLTVEGASNLKGATTLNSSLNVAGVSIFNSPVSANNTLTVAGSTTLKNIASVGSTLTVNGAINANNALNVSSVSTLRGAVNLGSTLSVTGSGTFNGILTANNAINASGNITSSGQIKGSTVNSTGRMVTGEFLQINGTATAGDNCSPNGLQGKSSTGAILSCVNGKWLSSSTTNVMTGMYATYTYTTGTSGTVSSCIARNAATGGCSCSAGTKVVKVNNTPSNGGCSGASGGQTCNTSSTNLYACL